MERVASIFTRVLAGIDRQLAKSPLSPSERRVVRLLYARPGLTDLEVATALAMARPQLSRVMSGLIDNGLAASEPSPRHGRQRLLALTDSGKEAASEIDQASKAAFADEFERLAPAEQHVLYNVQQLDRSVRSHAGSASIELRDPTPEDIGGMFRAMLAAGKPYGSTEAYLAEQASWLAAFTQQLQYDYFPGWIAYRAGRRVGGCLAVIGLKPSLRVDLDATHATIFALYVEPQARRLGIGSRLINAAVERSRELDLLSLRISLAPHHDRLAKILKHHKFKPEREQVQDFRYDTKHEFRDYVYGFALRRPGRPKNAA